MKNRICFTLLIASIFLCLNSCKSKADKQEDIVLKPPTSVISFLSTRDGNFEIYTMTADGNNVKNLSNNEALDYSTSWSPNGKELLFYSDRDGNKEIYKMNVDGTDVIRLTTDEQYNESPTWSPDMKKILFTKELRKPNDTIHASNGEIFSIDLDGKNETRLTNKDGFDSGAFFSPDGSRIAFYGESEEGN